MNIVSHSGPQFKDVSHRPTRYITVEAMPEGDAYVALVDDRQGRYEILSSYTDSKADAENLAAWAALVRSLPLVLRGDRDGLQAEYLLCLAAEQEEAYAASERAHELA